MDTLKWLFFVALDPAGSLAWLICLELSKEADAAGKAILTRVRDRLIENMDKEIAIEILRDNI